MAPILTTEHFLQRRSWTTYSHDAPKGSGYCEDQGQRLELVKVWKLWGWPIFQWVIDRDEIPAHVWINRAIFNDWGGWRSRLHNRLETLTAAKGQL